MSDELLMKKYRQWLAYYRHLIGVQNRNVRNLEKDLAKRMSEIRELKKKLGE